jgi:hypothetical protein
MSTKKQELLPTEEEAFKSRCVDEVIGRHVMHSLGQPNDLQRVQVRRLWADRYRVNIVVGVDVACVRIAHSYFLVADEDGNILTSTPQITKQY